MATFSKGELVLVYFPFADLSGTKLRPALVLATLPGPDVMLCMITSQRTPDPAVVLLTPADVSPGYIQRSSYIRPTRLFTTAPRLIQHSIGRLSPTKLNLVTAMLIRILQQ